MKARENNYIWDKRYYKAYSSGDAGRQDHCLRKLVWGKPKSNRKRRKAMKLFDKLTEAAGLPF